MTYYDNIFKQRIPYKGLLPSCISFCSISEHMTKKPNMADE